MKKQFIRAVFILLSFVCSYWSFSQNARDSLFSVWNNSKLHDTVRMNALEEFTTYFLRTKPDSAIQLARIHQNYAKRTFQLKHNAYGLFNEATALKNKGHSSEGIYVARKALAEFEKLNMKQNVANTNNLLGSLFMQQGDMKRSMDSYLNSLKIKYELGDESGAANTLNNIGNFYVDSKNYSEALNYLFQCLALRKKLKEQMGAAKAYNNIGNAYGLMNKNDSALYYYRLSLSVRKQMKKLKGSGALLGNIAEVLYELGKKDSAAYYYNLSRENAIAVGDVFTVIINHIRLGELNIDQNNLALAKTDLDAAEKMLKEQSDMGLKESLYKGYFTLYQAWKKPELALKYHLLYVEMKDSLSNDKLKEEISRSKMRFEFEQRESQEREERAIREGVLKSELSSQKIISEISVFAGIVVLILLVIAIRAFRRSNQAMKKIAVQNQLIIEQKNQVEEKQKEILDSIHYAKRIQNALLSSSFYINRELTRLNKNSNKKS